MKKEKLREKKELAQTHMTHSLPNGSGMHFNFNGIPPEEVKTN
jgi:hypothetical protein